MRLREYVSGVCGWAGVRVCGCVVQRRRSAVCPSLHFFSFLVALLCFRVLCACGCANMLLGCAGVWRMCGYADDVGVRLCGCAGAAVRLYRCAGVRVCGCAASLYGWTTSVWLCGHLICCFQRFLSKGLQAALTISSPDTHLMHPFQNVRHTSKYKNQCAHTQGTPQSVYF